MYKVERAALAIIIVSLVLAGLYYDWLDPKWVLIEAITAYGWILTRATLGKVTGAIEAGGESAKPVKGLIEEAIGKKGAIADTLIAAVSKSDPETAGKPSKARKLGNFLLGALKFFLVGRV